MKIKFFSLKLVKYSNKQIERDVDKKWMGIVVLFYKGLAGLNWFATSNLYSNKS